jgi:hypothetical protein
VLLPVCYTLKRCDYVVVTTCDHTKSHPLKLQQTGTTGWYKYATHLGLSLGFVVCFFAPFASAGLNSKVFLLLLRLQG